jgi:hypothetical protein
MNVKELKAILNTYDENTKVMISYKDSWDWIYKSHILNDDVYLDDPYDHGPEDTVEDNGETEGDVLVIKFRLD